ncbi:MAG TPA: hypothetical protein VHO25_20300 [Polyangiaceae bacterium]|nr:hypothetical protein [Polyangiaceae bacterium]
MPFSIRLLLKGSHLRWLLQLLAVVGVVFLQNHAFAAIFAPVCDPSATTMPVAAPPSEGDSGEIDVWDCGDTAFSERGPSFNAVPSRGGEGEIGSASASTPVAPAWKTHLPARPIQKRLIWGESSSTPLPTGYATGPFRPPRLTKLP